MGLSLPPGVPAAHLSAGRMRRWGCDFRPSRPAGWVDRQDGEMRIVSLLPSATEIVYALGLGDDLVGVTFECDEPPSARTDKTVVVGGRDTRGMTPGEIDEYVKAQLAAGGDLYTLHADALAGLDPDLILTQDLCRVCALPSGSRRRTRSTTSAAAPTCCRSTRTRWTRCSTTFLTVGAAAGVADRAEDLVAEPAGPAGPGRRRGGRPAAAAGGGGRVGGSAVHRRALGARPGAGGRRRAGRRATRAPGRWQTTWAEFGGAAPDVVLVTPCGFHLDGAAAQAETVVAALPGRAGVGDRRGRPRGTARAAPGRRRRGDRRDPAPGRRAGAAAGRDPASGLTTRPTPVNSRCEDQAEAVSRRP